MPVTLSLDEARTLARAALMAAGTSEENARITAAALVAAMRTALPATASRACRPMQTR